LGTADLHNIGVFGGSFDPVHLGHIRAAELAQAALNLHEVVFVPAGNQWQKQSQTAGFHRLAMLKLALAEKPDFRISEIDLNRTGPTYSFDTVSELAALRPNAKLFFLLGTDAFAGLDSWHRADELLDLATFVVMSRPGTELKVPDVARGRFQVLDVPTLDLSSTAFREKYGLGLGYESQVPASVLTYIRENRLYTGLLGHERSAAH